MSMLPQVFSRLMKGKFAGTLESYLGPAYSRGLEVITFDDPVDITFFTVPDGPEDFNTKTEEGATITINRHFYFEGTSFAIKDKDLLTYNSIAYEMRGVEHREHGDFTYAYGKFIDRAEVDGSS